MRRGLINGDVTWRIVKDLNERGVPTAYGKEWRIENLQRLLLSKRIIGIREHNGATYPAQWPAIITPEDQENIRLAWKARKQKPGRPRESRIYVQQRGGLDDSLLQRHVSPPDRY